MRFIKNKYGRKFKPFFYALMALVLILIAVPGSASGQVPLLDPNAVRAAVRQMGMDSLATVIVPDPAGLTAFERITEPLTADLTTNPPTPAADPDLVAYARAKGITVQRAALQILGKALFWDQQTGSDGQACASCHFHAGSDNRSINTLNPGTRNTDATEAINWNPSWSQLQGGAATGPNYQLQVSDFPFHKLADPLETNYGKRDVLFDTDDAVGSIGTYHANFAGSPAPNYNYVNPADPANPVNAVFGTYDAKTNQALNDPNNPYIFQVGNNRTRSNGPRQAAPTINALFNFNNFWDGRADNGFNGLNMHGIKDLNAFVYFNSGGALIRDIIAGITDGSLASQSTAPPNSATSDEMAFTGRTMSDLGRKLLRLTGPGTGATATAIIELNPFLADNVTNNPAYQTVIGFTVTNQGSNYIHGATVMISGGGGTGAIGVATVTNGNLTAINVPAPTLTVPNPGGGGYVTPPIVTIVSTGLDTSAYASYTDAIVPQVIPLGAQQVSPTDSVLGNGAGVAGPWTFQPASNNSGRGINLSYVNLIQWAFVPTFWDAAAADGSTLLTPGNFHLMEENLSMFWGISIQMYEMLLRADQTPYDRFMAGDNTAFGAWDSAEAQDVMRGLLTYIATENTMQQVNPVFNNINSGACQLCHSGRELTEVASPNVIAKLFVATDMTVKMDHNRELAIVAPSSNFDVGFTNVGTRPSREDLGIGATAPLLPGTALSITRGRNMNQAWALLLVPAILFPGEPNPTRGSNIDGAFKIPHLRNVEMNGPYFHNGGSLTLKQAVEFYARHGDFADVNEPNIDVGLAMVQNIGAADVDLIVKFLLKLTDERVRWEQAPFDHPQLFVPNGHTLGTTHPILGTGYLADNFITLPAVGAAGRSALGLGALPNFMGTSSLPNQPGIDHFDE